MWPSRGVGVWVMRDKWLACHGYLAFEFLDLSTRAERSLTRCTATVRDDKGRAMGFARADERVGHAETPSMRQRRRGELIEGRHV